MNRNTSVVDASQPDTFPGHQDAGKVLKWISRQISSTSLGKDLLLTLEAGRDVQKNHLRAPHPLEALL